MTSPARPAARIHTVDEHWAEAAATLLQRFLTEEGFNVAESRVRTALDLLWRDRFHHAAVAVEHERAVAVATVSTQISVEFGRIAELGDLYVLPEHRDNGVANALIEHAKRWATDVGCAEMQLTLAAPPVVRERLRGYYLRRGFRDTGRESMSCGLQ